MLDTLGAVLTACLTVSPALGIDARQQHEMIAEAQRVWRLYEVTVREGEGEDCNRQLVVKSDAAALPEDMAPDSALGWVPFAAGRPRRVVFLRVSRASTLIADIGAGTRPDAMNRWLVGKLLGRVLAHEIGHVLLNSAQHQPRGLMRRQYHAVEVLQNASDHDMLDAGERALLLAATRPETRFARP